MAKRISIINFKGGVGKTTLTFNLGACLAWLHNARVLLIDMDHQSSLSIVCLKDAGWQRAVDGGRTVDEVFRSFVVQSPNLPRDEIIIKSPVQEIRGYYGNRYYHYFDSMDIAPASLHLDDTEIELTAAYQGNGMRSEWNKRTLMCRWIEETGIDEKYDYILFDCPPATKIVTQNAIAASHGYIVPVVPEAVMERGAPHLRDMMEASIDDWLKALSRRGSHRKMYVPDTELIGLVVTRIESARGGYTIDHRQHLTSMQRLWRNMLIQPYIGEGTGVSAALSSGFTVYDNRTATWSQNIGRRGIHTQYINLTQEIKRRIDAL